MADSNLLSAQLPASFLETPDLRIPFQAWLRGLQNYLLAVGGETFTDKRKAVLLIHYLGSQGQRVLLQAEGKHCGREISFLEKSTK